MKMTLTQLSLLALCLGATQVPIALGQNVGNTKRPLQSAPMPSSMGSTKLTHKEWSDRKKISDALSNNAWLNERWTGNDAPYAALRAQVERAFDTMTPQALVAQYAPAAKARPNDPIAQFAWGYAVHKAITSANYTVQNADDVRFAAEVALAETPFPQTYNFARLRFLIALQSPAGGGYHTLIGTAKRLLQKDANDFPVMMGLIALNSQNSDSAAQKAAYALIQKAIKQYPNKPQVYDMLGGWYYAQYILYHHPRDYHLSLDNYQRAMNMYPMTASRRSALPQVMDFLTRRYHQINGS